MAQSVVDETERMAAVAANSADLERVLHLGERLVVAAAPRTAADPDEPVSAMARMMGGGMADASRGRRRFGSDKQKSPGGSDRFANLGADAEAKVTFQMGLSFQASKQVVRLGKAVERHSETAYWNPSVVSDKQGKARVTFNVPKSLSAYRIIARGITAAETLAGQTTASITVR